MFYVNNEGCYTGLAFADSVLLSRVGNAFESVALTALRLDKNGDARSSAQRAAKPGVRRVQFNQMQ